MSQMQLLHCTNLLTQIINLGNQSEIVSFRPKSLGLNYLSSANKNFRYIGGPQFTTAIGPKISVVQ